MARVLVVDDDPWVQRMVSSVLTHVGHTVDLAGDGWEGLVAADRVRPDLVVVDTKLPSADGWKLLETLRARPEMASMPALILTPFIDKDRRGSSFQQELDEVLVTPFRLEELTEKVARLLGTRGRIGNDGDTEEYVLQLEPVREPAPVLTPAVSKPAINKPAGSKAAPRVTASAAVVVPALAPRRRALLGTLQQFGAASVLMLLDLERRSGVLAVNGTRGRGRCYLREGRILRATVEGQPHLRAALAVYAVITWTEGWFEFQAGEVEGEDEIRSSTSFLLMEGARRQDEIAAEKQRN